MSFTVINTFTLKDPARAEEFEERFLSHVEWMRSRPGFVAHQAVRATDEPGVYVNFGWWQRPEDFQAVLADATFKAHAEEFHEIVDVEADPSMGVLRLDGAPSGPDDHLVVEYGTAEDESFTGRYRSFAGADGFVPAPTSPSRCSRAPAGSPP
ncbi:antibiotic biosynthesis monooxygenase family protein [Streptomyces sp. PmtG]